jgi:hypothetical protein
LEATVSEIHAWPARPEGFAEPLFPTGESKREVMEHLARAPWLARASEVPGGSAGAGAKVLDEPARLTGAGRAAGGRGRVLRCEGRRSLDRRRVVGVVERWREVDSWWEPEGGVDRSVWRVELSGGAVVDLCRDRRTGSWSVVGLVD